MNKVKRLLMTILTSGIATILSFLISFILTPYITNKLGVEAYGFVTLAKNFHSCVEHFLIQYRLLPGSPARGQNYSAEDDDNRLKWILNICYGNRIPHDVKQLYFICNYYRLARNEIVHCGTGRVELRQAKTELNNLTDDLAVSNIRGHLNAPNDFTNLNFDDQVLFSRAARTICDRIYKDSKYDWDAVLENYRTKINSFILSNDSEGKKKARILNFLSQIYPINVNDSRLIESISHFVV